MSDTEMDELSNEGEVLTFRVLNVLNLTTPQGDRVQWFRAEAEMQRWQEQGEQKLAELLRTNRSFLKMEDTWTALALQNAPTKPGHSAYAKQKAAMYRKRAEMAQALILGVGYGDLLASDASLVQRVQEERDAERKLSFASVEAFVQQAFSLLPVLVLVRIAMSGTHTVSEGPRYDTPRICHGPLAITSSLGAPCLSPELKRACTPISDVGCGGRWSAGDLGMWHQRNGHDDKAIVSSSFGRVWVGYLGEEEEAKRALRWDTLQWGVNLVLTLVLFFGYHLAVRFLFWILALGGMI
ncbi:hypothetical protein B0H14DRAFT_3151655 [Mycena olivaceomarginata]|nr:hypothetical protein B0H14DRAFT_3151655 [Mycena olivaceomarginata]